MKRKLINFILITTFLWGINISYNQAYSEEFTLLLETMNVPKENIFAKSINEDIYNEYKLFVYGSPLDGYNGQRWKNVMDGHWTRDGSAWNGNGTRGEYWILGTNYNGKEVHNHKFPVDIEPPTSPTEWRYAIISDALESWQETEKYMDDTQKEYMLTQKLMRNNNTYDLTVGDIGFDKVRVENYATWKTNGTVYTQRYDMNNKKWAANFMIPPMAGDAQLEGYAEFPLGMEYTIEEQIDSINIPIIYDCKVTNLTNYAKKEHVKEIKSEVYINGKYIEDVVDSQSLEVKKETLYLVDRNNYSNNASITLNIQIKSKLYTTFITDGALVDVKSYTIIINFGEKIENNSSNKYNDVDNEYYVENEEFPPPIITSVEINRIENNKEKPLLISKKTGREFICAGQTILIRVKAINLAKNITIEFEGDSSITTFDKLTKLFEWTEPKSRNEKTFFNSLKKFEDMYDGKIGMTAIDLGEDEQEFECKYIIPYETKQTLHSWNSLRNISNDAFSINENKLFSRITAPYEIVFKVRGSTGTTTKRIELDVFERWDTLYNRNLSEFVR